MANTPQARIAFADSGDTVSDANFEEDVADNNILRLFNLREWCEEMAKDQDKLRSGAADLFLDKLFDNEMNTIVHECRKHYEAADFKLALKSGLYELSSARDFYRSSAEAAGLMMHRDLVFRYIELQTLLLAVIAPHWSEYIWLEVLKKPSTIRNELFPEAPVPIASYTAAREYVRAISSNITSAEAAQQKKKAKGKDIGFDPKLPKKLTIFAADKFPTWQEKYISLVSECYDSSTTTFDDKTLTPKIAKLGEMKKAMPFVQGLKKRLMAGENPETVFSRKLAFDEVSTLKDMVAGLKKAAGLKEVEIVRVEEGGKVGRTVSGEVKEGLPPQAENAVPGIPTFQFDNVEWCEWGDYVEMTIDLLMLLGFGLTW